MGWVPWGGYATEAVMSAWAAVPVPASMSWTEAAAFPIAYGTAYGALKRIGLEGDETVAVFGQGPVGLAPQARLGGICQHPDRVHLRSRRHDG